MSEEDTAFMNSFMKQYVEDPTRSGIFKDIFSIFVECQDKGFSGMYDNNVINEKMMELIKHYMTRLGTDDSIPTNIIDV
jgi:hypothetical protein